jgi:glycerol-3-phosphate O-acyltransferase
LNYTRTLEGESFPGELRGAPKVKESTSRVLGAAEIFRMNFGTMMVDFCDPISVANYTKSMMSERPSFDPF